MNRIDLFEAAHSPNKRTERKLRRPALLPFPGRVLALLAALTICAVPSPANAAADPSTRLVRCAEQSCLLVTGYREDPALAVAINGHVVPVEGRRKWRVALPVETVRNWSAPYARTIEVALRDRAGEQGTSAEVRLPIGLLGGVGDLAHLVVSVR